MLCYNCKTVEKSFWQIHSSQLFQARFMQYVMKTVLLMFLWSTSNMFDKNFHNTRYCLHGLKSNQPLMNIANIVKKIELFPIPNFGVASNLHETTTVNDASAWYIFCCL